MLSGMFDLIGPRALGLARVIVGFAVLIRSIVVWQVLSRLTRPEVLRAPYLEWVPRPTIAFAIGVVVVWTASSILFTIGWKVQVVGPVLMLTIVGTLALDVQTYSNHLYLMAWLVLLLSIADSGAGLNISRTDRQVVRWPVILLMIQLSIVYGFSALTKLNASFLSGEVLAGTLGTGLMSFPDSLRTPRVLGVVAALAVLAELFIAVFIWRPRFRGAAFVLGLGLHLSITLFMAQSLQLLVFSLEMLALYPLFLSSHPLIVVWDDDCVRCRSWMNGYTGLDLLRTLQPIGKSDRDNPLSQESQTQMIHAVHHGRTTTGFAAVTRILEHLVPTLWLAPILRLPGIRHLGESWYQRRLEQQSSAAPTGTP